MKHKSAVIVYSFHTEEYAKKLAKKYKFTSLIKVTTPPTKETLMLKTNLDIVIGIGGGSVIDTAKIIAKDKRCVAIPTTASGAAMTPYATIWGDKKNSIVTELPILRIDCTLDINLPFEILIATFFDALSHCVESLCSINSTRNSRRNARNGLKYLKLFLDTKDIFKLIRAGNYAGRAIAVNKTNAIHAISYPLTTKYNVKHGLACGLILVYFIKYIPSIELYKYFNFTSSSELIKFLKCYLQKFLVDTNFWDIEQIIDLALEYKKIRDCKIFIDADFIKKILKEIIQDFK